MNYQISSIPQDKKSFCNDIFQSLNEQERLIIKKCCDKLLREKLTFSHIPVIISDLLFDEIDFCYSLDEFIHIYKKILICVALSNRNNNLTQAARLLNIKRTTLIGILKQLNLSRNKKVAYF